MSDGDKQGVKQFYDNDAETYDERFDTDAGDRDDSVHQTIVQQFINSLPESAQTFELGCGTGRFTATTAGSGFEVAATDISREMLTQTRYRVRGTALVDPVQADATNLPYQAGSFDAGVMINVLSHLPNPEAAFKEIGRILDDDAVFLFNYPRLWSLYFPIGAYVNARERSIHGDVYTHWYRQAEIEQLLSIAGLDVVERFGHVHTPQRHIPAVTQLLDSLDKLSRQSAIKRIAPVEFVIAKRSPE